MTWSRRRVLQLGALASSTAAGLWSPGPLCAAVAGGARRISLKNLHTAEHIDIEYFRDGVYVSNSLAAIQSVLRDYRTGQTHAMDPRLMDYLVDTAQKIGVDAAFDVISGYRSPQTNAQLREHSAGVAEHSLHMEGRAIDVRVAGVDCAELAARALDLQRGGVGYYRASDFVHLDTGAFRTWKG